MRYLNANEIPDSWSLDTLGDAAEKILGGGTPSKAVKHYYEGTIPWVTVKDLNGMYITDALDHITEEAISKSASNLIPAGNVLLATRMAVGSAHLNKVAVAINQDLKAIFPRKDVSPRYLTYWLRAHSQLLSSLGAGSTVKGLGLSQLRRLPFPKPPIKEQDAIVNVVSSIDEALEASKAVLEQLRALFLNLRDVLVLRGMPKRHHSYKTEKRIGSVPKSWNIHLLSDCATIQTGIAKGKKYKGGKIVSLPYLRVANVQDGYFDLTEMKQIDVMEDEVKRYTLQYGDVLLTEGGDYDKLGRGHMWRNEITPCLHQNHVFSVRADQSLLLPEYLNYITSSSYGKRYFLNNSKQTTNLASINSTQLKSLPCPLPSMEEQAEIIDVVDSIQQNVLLEQAKFEALASAKKGLSRQLLTGKLRVAVDDG